MTRSLLVIAIVLPGLFIGGEAFAQALELKPNLKPLPAFDISMETDVFGRPTLKFGTTTWNSGDGPLEIVAGETGQDANGYNRQNVYQRVYLDDGSSYRRLAGTFTWHPGHNHFHLDEYATYTLQPVDANGQSNRTGNKTSFCLMDTYQVDASLPGSPDAVVYSECSNVAQGMSVGWGDEYGAHLPDQEIIVTDLADGDYRLIIEADPKNRLIETNDSDNVSCVLLRLNVSALNVEVLNPDSCETGDSPPADSPTVIAISPDHGQRDTLVPVTIEGTGFREGLTVAFEGGNGPAPTVSQVDVVDESTITALVTIKKGGPKNNAAWDLRVGDYVLPRAFAILP